MNLKTQQLNQSCGKLSCGKVWLLGAGPGDPELMTVKAMRILAAADLIFFDQLVSEEIRQLFPKGVPAFYVGKKKNEHSFTQEQINRLIVAKARQGKSVVRVKGGDPFVFGRGGEEMLEVAQAGIPVEVVPGITSASGCTTAANIPLTHRGLSQACTFVTAHAERDLAIDWDALASFSQTIVIYMGVSKAKFVQDRLLNAGLAESTPVAIIENGCRVEQRELIGELHQLAKLTHENSVVSPALIVVGKVVSFRETLQQVSDQHKEYFNEIQHEFESKVSGHCA